MSKKSLAKIIIMALCATGSYFTGRFMGIRSVKYPIEINTIKLKEGIAGIESQRQILEEQNRIRQSGTGYVGSKSGTKYYLPWCGAVTRIKESNKIWFESEEIAIRAGYTKAVNCQGL